MLSPGLGSQSELLLGSGSVAGAGILGELIWSTPFVQRPVAAGRCGCRGRRRSPPPFVRGKLGTPAIGVDHDDRLGTIREPWRPDEPRRLGIAAVFDLLDPNP